MSSNPQNTPVSADAVSYQTVSESQAGQRLDNFLMSRLKGVPKSRVYRLIRKGEIRVNKKRIKPEYKLQTEDLVRIPPIRISSRNTQIPPTEELQTLLKAAILFSDDHLLVLNKPSGIPVHAGTGVKTGLVEALRFMFPEVKEIELVHRLDKGTSGCLLLTRDSKSLKVMSAQFRGHAIKKVYHALVQGNWPAKVKEINAALSRQEPQGGERFVNVSRDGKSATTRFKILETYPQATLLEARPETGRTHQIRVHTQLAGCPVIGDEKYADSQSRKVFRQAGIRRLCLHAAELTLTHPANGEKLVFKAPYDKQFQAAISILQAAGD